MIDGPHIFGFSPVALCINLTSALASARLVSSVSASINAETLILVGLVLLSAILQSLIQRKGKAQPGTSPAKPSQRSGAWWWGRATACVCTSPSARPGTLLHASSFSRRSGQCVLHAAEPLPPIGIARLRAAGRRAETKVGPKLKRGWESPTGMRYWAWFVVKLAVATAALRGMLKLGSPIFPPEKDLLAPLAKGVTFLLCDLVLMLCFLLFAGALYLVVWDQRYRCRVCLRRLRMPIARGAWSRILLFGRPQIEYICPYGHGTLREDDLHISGLSAAEWTANSDDMWAELCAPGVAKLNPQDGVVWMGLAEISLAGGDKKRALQLFAQALSKEWPAQEESRRKSTQLKYAGLLNDAGRQGEAISLLLSMIEQHGDDPAVGKAAADTVKAIGSPQQLEQAYAALASHFPADASVWLRLGDARFAAEQDESALDAYRYAAKADPGNADTAHAVARVEEILRLDPTRRGLAVRERARRWDEILQRVLDAVAGCGTSPEIEKAKPLLKKRSISLEVSDQKMQNALSIWKAAPAPCKTDAVLTHILSKLPE